jgi:hypothetical protein
MHSDLSLDFPSQVPEGGVFGEEIVLRHLEVRKMYCVSLHLVLSHGMMQHHFFPFFPYHITCWYQFAAKSKSPTHPPYCL